MLPQINEKLTNIRSSRALKNLNNKLTELKLKNFRHKYKFSFDVKNFTVKTVTTEAELFKALQLRQKVFTQTYGLESNYELDFDKYDLASDHIIVIDRDSDQVIGTYRVNSTIYSKKFYSQKEFTLDPFLKSDGVKVELGRACIHEDYRNGITLNLVWKGIAKYATLTDASHLFGCASIKVTDPNTAMGIFNYYKDTNFSNDYYISPTSRFLFPVYNLKTVEIDPSSSQIEIPPLFKSYLKAGAKIASLPAYDRHFSCTDFLTILDLSELNPVYRKRFFPKD
jgi:putative hemolysin